MSVNQKNSLLHEWLHAAFIYFFYLIIFTHGHSWKRKKKDKSNQKLHNNKKVFFFGHPENAPKPHSALWLVDRRPLNPFIYLARRSLGGKLKPDIECGRRMLPSATAPLLRTSHGNGSRVCPYIHTRRLLAAPKHSDKLEPLHIPRSNVLNEGPRETIYSGCMYVCMHAWQGRPGEGEFGQPNLSN